MAPFGGPKSEFGSLAENGRFLNKPLIWKCYFPVPAALVPIWRPKVNYLGALPKMVDFLISPLTHHIHRAQLVWPRFESNSEQPGTELRFHEGFCL